MGWLAQHLQQETGKPVSRKVENEDPYLRLSFIHAVACTCANLYTQTHMYITYTNKKKKELLVVKFIL